MSLSMIVPNSRDWPGKIEVPDFCTSTKHLKTGLYQKYQSEHIHAIVVML